MRRKSIGSFGHARPSSAAHARRFDHELVVLDLVGGAYYSLDAIGARLWEGLASGKTPQEIARDVASEYDTTFDVALKDLVALADTLIERGLFVLEDEGR